MGRPLDLENPFDVANAALLGTDVDINRLQDGHPVRQSLQKIHGRIAILQKGSALAVADVGANAVLTTSDVREISYGPNCMIIHTNNSKYRVSITDEDRKAKLPTLLYLKRGYLDFDDYMPDGFVDGGRNTEISVDEKWNMEFDTKMDREIIVVDARRDSKLRNLSEICRTVLQGPGKLRYKIEFITDEVANMFGGKNVPDDFMGRHAEEMERLQKQNPNKFVLLGDIQYGVCRHRALAFKYIADRVGVPARLVRGIQPWGAHAWNVVKPGKKFQIVDIMQNALLDEDSPIAVIYRRLPAGSRDTTPHGFGGHSIRPYSY